MVLTVVYQGRKYPLYENAYELAKYFDAIKTAGATYFVHRDVFRAKKGRQYVFGVGRLPSRTVTYVPLAPGTLERYEIKPISSKEVEIKGARYYITEDGLVDEDGNQVWVGPGGEVSYYPICITWITIVALIVILAIAVVIAITSTIVADFFKTTGYGRPLECKKVEGTSYVLCTFPDGSVKCFDQRTNEILPPEKCGAGPTGFGALSAYLPWIVGAAVAIAVVPAVVTFLKPK